MAKRGDTIDRPWRREDGFSLLEGQVVVVILGIIVALGVLTIVKAPTALSDTTAQALTRQALAAQRLFYSDRGLWGQASEIQDLEPSLHFVDLGSGGPEVLGKVYVKVEADVATLAARSATGNCYWVRTAPSGTTFATAPFGVPPGDTDFDRSW